LSIGLAGISLPQNLPSFPDKGRTESISTLKLSNDRYFIIVYSSKALKKLHPVDVAVVYFFDPKKQQYVEVFLYQAEQMVMIENAIPLEYYNFQGFMLKLSDGVSDFDGSIVVQHLQDSNSFVKVFHGGTIELIDFEGDGIPEIFESDWPDDDGFPKDSKVFILKKGTYQQIALVKWGSRLSQEIQRRIIEAKK
jgi:hypothetical protein